MPDTANHWLSVVALSLIALLIHGCTLLSLGVLLPHWASHFGGQAGSAATAMLIAMSLANLPVGWALGRIGTRATLLAGVMLVAAGWTGGALAQDRIMLATAMAVAGTGVAASTIVPGIAIITRDMADRRGLALAIFLGATVLAGAVVPPFAGRAIESWHWRGAMAGGGLIVALTCAPLILFVSRGPVPGAQRAAAPAPLRPALTSAPFLAILLAFMLLQLSINGILFATVDSLMQQGLSQARAVGGYSLANLMGLPALLLGGALADRIGARPALVGACLLLAAGSAALLGIGPLGLTGLAGFILLWGVASALPGQCGSMLLADSVAADTFPRLLGIVTAVAALFGAAAPVLTDQMRAPDGSHALAIWVYALLALAAAPLVALVRPAPGTMPAR
ncbi:MFS transporter [Sphingobium sp. CAP-1]|uniref:MFS transporter n=1 Tax=Sphingobium sp. CAP-1 TaxID=2676077 RepID=UPI001E596BC6|nr:MFS transporter [Sphingobium sp. CAP-1]